MPLKWDTGHEGAPVDAGALSHGTEAGARAAAHRHAAGGPPLVRALLWPHRSLPLEGFAWVIAITFTLLMAPLIMVLGSPVLWGLLPFVTGAVWLLWYFLRRNYRDGRLTEELTLWSDRIEIRRCDPGGGVREWHANPYWVRVTLHESGGPVENYVTLSGGGRDVELGAFLSPDERVAMRDELELWLARAR